MIREARREIKRLLKANGMASLTELEHNLGITRNWISSFVSAPVTLDITKSKGTHIYKFYMAADKDDHG